MSITVISPALKTAPEMLLKQICHCSPSHIGLVLNFTVLGVIFYCLISATRQMVIVVYPYPGCTFNTNDVAEALAVMLLQIHASGSHSGGTPDGNQTT